MICDRWVGSQVRLDPGRLGRVGRSAGTGCRMRAFPCEVGVAVALATRAGGLVVAVPVVAFGPWSSFNHRCAFSSSGWLGSLDALRSLPPLPTPGWGWGRGMGSHDY